MAGASTQQMLVEEPIGVTQAQAAGASQPPISEINFNSILNFLNSVINLLKL